MNNAAPTSVPRNDILAVLEARTTALSVQECARLLSVSPKAIYNYAHAGKFPVFKVVGTIRINPAELAAHLRANASTLPIAPSSPSASPEEETWDRRRHRKH